jgi:hypothetical protein
MNPIKMLENADETGLSIQIFRPESPFTKEEVLNPDFLPADHQTAENGENME